MKYSYTGKGFEISDTLKARIEKKIDKLGRYFREEPEVSVLMRQLKGARDIIEITLSTGGIFLRAEETSNDMYLSIDRAVGKLESQLRRYRGRLQERVHTAEIEDVVPEYDETPMEVVRIKKFPVKPMSTEDAITQMELLGHSFFLFQNEENGTLNVVYSRSDGGYGLLQPEI